MSSEKLYRSSHELESPYQGGMPTGVPGKMPVTARLAARPINQIIFRAPSRDDNGVAADADVAVERAASSSGQALPGDLRSRFESSLGADLSNVRVHTGAESAQAASAVGARAYATGNDIHFAAGAYDPQSAFGVHLLAHEVAHTVQQRGAAPTRQHRLEVSFGTDSAELEADRAADAMVSGVPASLGATPSALSRKEDATAPAAESAAAPATDGAVPPTGEGAAAATPRRPKWKDQTISIPVFDKLGGNLNLTYGDKPGAGVDLKGESKVPLFEEKYSQGLQIAPGVTGSVTGSIKLGVGASLQATPAGAWIPGAADEEDSLQLSLTGAGQVSAAATGSLQVAAGIGVANLLALEGGVKGAITAKVGGSASVAGTLTKKPDGTETGAFDFKVGLDADLSAAASIVADVVVPGDRINVYEKTLGKLVIGKATVAVHATYANGTMTHHPMVKTAEWFPVPPLEDRATRPLTDAEREARFPSEHDAGASGASADGHPDAEVAMTDQELFTAGQQQAVTRLGAIHQQIVPVTGGSEPGLGGTMYGSVNVDGVAVRGMIPLSPAQQARDRAEGRQVIRVTQAQVHGWSTVGTPTPHIVAGCAKTPDAVAIAYLANHVELTLIGAAFDHRQVPPRMGSCNTDGSMGTTDEPEPPPPGLEHTGNDSGDCDPDAASCEDAGPRAD